MVFDVARAKKDKKWPKRIIVVATMTLFDYQHKELM
jgi:hypothetical protein